MAVALRRFDSRGADLDSADCGPVRSSGGVGRVPLALIRLSLRGEDDMNQADTAWMLISTALVLLMTPALAFFYGGLVRSKNALNTMMMSFISLGFVGVLWATIGYSLAFAPGNNWIGDTSRVFLHGVGLVRTGHDPAPALHVLPGHVRDHHRRADLGRHRRAHAVLGLRRVHLPVGARSSTARSATGCGAAAGWPTWARSTSRAARSCT